MGLPMSPSLKIHPSNPALHIEIDCHFIQEKILFGDITTSFVNSYGALG